MRKLVDFNAKVEKQPVEVRSNTATNLAYNIGVLECENNNHDLEENELADKLHNDYAISKEEATQVAKWVFTDLYDEEA